MWMDGSVPGSSTRNGKINRADDSFCDWNGWNKNCLDFWNFPEIQISENFVHFLSGILDHYDHSAGDLFYFCQKSRLCATEKTGGIYIVKRKCFVPKR